MGYSAARRRSIVTPPLAWPNRISIYRAVTRSIPQIVFHIVAAGLLLFSFECKNNNEGGIPKPIEYRGERQPAFSPDGKFIAYSTRPDYEIWIFELASEESEYVTSGRSPDWSGDGKKLVYVQDRSIYSIDIATKEVKRLVTEGFSPDWSPDCNKIAFSINAGDSAGLYVVDSDGNNRYSVGEWGWIEPDWHPSGNQFAFTGWISNRGGVCMADTNGGRAHLVAEGGNSPVFSFGGAQIVFCREIQDENNISHHNIWVTDTNGNNMTQLTFEPEGQNWSAAYDPAWSPGDSLIVYTLVERIDCSNVVVYSYHIWMMDATGINKRQLTGVVRKTFGCK